MSTFSSDPSTALSADAVIGDDPEAVLGIHRDAAALVGGQRQQQPLALERGRGQRLLVDDADIGARRRACITNPIPSLQFDSFLRFRYT